MKFNKVTLSALAAIVLLLLGYCAGRGTSGRTDAAAEHAHGPAETPTSPTIWTCSMHPQIQQSEPGDCPICGMDLIPLEDDSGEDEAAGTRTVRLSQAAKAMARIETTTLTRFTPEVAVRMVGQLETDRTRVRSIAARFPGRIEELFVNFEGTRVSRGDHLARIYSPELLTAQSELLQAVRFDPESRAAQAAREKLRLWDLPPGEIDAIIERGTPSDTLTIYAPIGGIVAQQAVNEGDYLQTGQMLFEIADLSQLWLNLDAYESDIGWIRLGQQVRFTVEAYPGREFTGTVAFIEPYLDPATRTINVRVIVENERQLLKPGMFARGVVQPKIGADGEVFADQLAGKFISPMHPWVVKDAPGQCDVCGMDLVAAADLGYQAEGADGEAPLVVPSSAVLRTGTRAVVYVEVPDAERLAYEGREIVLGPRTASGFVVLEGLRPGENVVTQGAFKLDSSLQIQAKPSMMSVAGRAEGTEMNAGRGSGDEGLQVSAEEATAVLPAYLELQDALASDDLEAAKAALRSMMAESGHQGALPDLIHTMLTADSLEAIRRPHFETLSNALIAAVEANPDALEQELIQMHCPMVYPDRGADWLQAEEPLRNPYFGAAMLSCGERVGGREPGDEGEDAL